MAVPGVPKKKPAEQKNPNPKGPPLGVPVQDKQQGRPAQAKPPEPLTPGKLLKGQTLPEQTKVEPKTPGMRASQPAKHTPALGVPGAAKPGAVEPQPQPHAGPKPQQGQLGVPGEQIAASMKDEDGSLLKEGAMAAKQLPGKEQMPEYTVDRPMSFDEIQRAPAGIINTPHATIRKTVDGKFEIRGLTPAAKQALEVKKATVAKSFGNYPGVGAKDPDAPKLPIRPFGRSFNPFSGKFIDQDGNVE